MPAPLNKKALLTVILNSIDKSGWQAIVQQMENPFKIRIFRTAYDVQDICVYIWNCTHGGGSARPKDEYRVQLTGVVPVINPNAITLLLGWHSGYGVFVGFDITRHSGQASPSPSIQVKDSILLNAHNHAFSSYTRKNGEIAICFRPEYLVDYAINSSNLHRVANTELLNNIDSRSMHDQVAIALNESKERRITISKIYRKYRDVDFRKRVLGAYNQKCAACGVQLGLIDAAHIIPVAADNSTDETCNGIALCKLHHAAFDKNLISFNSKFKIEISTVVIERLRKAKLLEGYDKFKDGLLPAIHLPNDVRDYPLPEYIEASREIRKWNITL